MMTSMYIRAGRWLHRCGGAVLLLSLVACADDNPVSPSASPVPSNPATPSPGPASPAAPGSLKLTLSRTDVVFNAMAGAALHDTAAIAVSAASPDALSDLRAVVSYGQGKRGDWLAAEVKQVASAASVNLRATSPSLPPGDYTATVKLTAPGAVPESLTVTAHVASGAGIGVNATKICFTGTYTGPNARPDDVRITSLDGSPVDGLKATISYDDGSTQEWLLAGFDNPSAPTRLRLLSNMGAMPPGIYHATVQVSSTTPGVAPVSISVTLEVRPLQSSTLTIHLETVGLGGAGNGRLTATGIDCVLTNGVQSGDCEESYAPGTIVHVTALPATGQEFYHVSGCPGNCTPTEFDVTMSGLSYRFEGGFGGLASKIVVRIDWEGPQNGGAAFVSGPHGLMCGYYEGRCEALIDGGVEDYMPAPDGEYGASFLRWEGACAGLATCIVHFDTPGTTKTVTAVFHSSPSTVGPFRLQGAGASGSVKFNYPPVVGAVGTTGTPLTCRIVGGFQQGLCEGLIEGAAGTFTITVVPDPGSIFVWWQVGGFEGFGGGGPVGQCAETSPTCTLTATRGGTHFDGIITFASASSFSLEIEVQGPGEVSFAYSPTRIFGRCPTICKEYFQPGTTATFYAYPGEGASFLGWTDCTKPSGTTCEMDMSGNRHVVARFGP